LTQENFTNFLGDITLLKELLPSQEDVPDRFLFVEPERFLSEDLEAHQRTVYVLGEVKPPSWPRFWSLFRQQEPSCSVLVAPVKTETPDYPGRLVQDLADCPIQTIDEWEERLCL